MTSSAAILAREIIDKGRHSHLADDRVYTPYDSSDGDFDG